MKFTNEQIEKARNAESAGELLALAKENGVELTEEEAETYFNSFHKESRLADEELGNVSGGGLCDPEPTIYTKMICRSCGANTFWIGNYVNGQTYKCPLCSAEAYYGDHTTDSTGW